MIDNEDASSSTLRLLVWEGLKSYPTHALHKFLEDEDPIVRTSAARVLHLRGEEQTFAYAIRISTDKRDYVREIAMFTLGQLGTPGMPYRLQSIPLLAEHLLSDMSPDVRATAAAALGHLRATEAKAALLENAKHSDPDVRANVAAALCRLDQTEDIVAALKKLQNDPIQEVRMWARIEE